MGLDGVELVMAYEEEFGVSITDPAAARMLTPRDVVDYLVPRVEGRTRDDIAAAVRRITVEQLGLDDDEYGEDKRFVQDMGAD